MLAYLKNRSRAACTLALFALCGAAMAGASAESNGVRYGIAPALDCNGISKLAPNGQWIEANGISTSYSGTALVSLSFGEAPTTDAFHVAMNGAGMEKLALVEVQGTDGVWRKAWEGHLGAPAANFSNTCFERQLPQKQVVQALRFTFRDAPGQVDVNHAALLRR